MGWPRSRILEWEFGMGFGADQENCGRVALAWLC
jgi:hypothetical protein